MNLKFPIQLIFLFMAITSTAQSSEVRFSVVIQESLVNQYGESYVIEAFKLDYEFFEESITNAIEYWGLDIGDVLEQDYSGTQTLKIVSIHTIPDSLFESEPLSTSTYLNRFLDRSDGYFDNISPDSLCLKVNQARIMYILDNDATNTSGTAGTQGGVIRWSSVDPMFFTHITAHELGHMFFAPHIQVQLDDFVIIQGDTIAAPNDWTLMNGIGPYQPILSSSSAETILNSNQGHGIISSSIFHPNLKLTILNQQDTIVNIGDTIRIQTQIHESWAKTNPRILIKNEIGNILIDSIHVDNEMSHEVIVPSNLSGNYPLKLILMNEPTNESDTIQLNFTIDNNTSTIENDNSINGSVNIFPNPAFKQITIDLSNLNGDAKKFSLYDLSGTIFLRQNIIKKEKVNLDIENLVNGIYFVEIEFEDRNKITRKILVNN